MTTLDWLVVVAYLGLMLVGAYWLGRSQTSRGDYYLGGYGLPGWTLATSIIATQCSTNSLLGAPAFVGFVIGGGLIWLQYELAVPLAMLLLCVLFVPIRQAGVISIYSFLESRLGLASRLIVSACFLFFRGVATGVTVYGVASVIEMISGLSYFYAVLVLMGCTIAYDLMGGMKAVVMSDVVQMFVLLAAIVVALFGLSDAFFEHYDKLAERSVTLVNDWGITSGNHYGFWPMLFGGVFLYMAYYGCDQSQAQRLLSARSVEETQRVLYLNGLLRFPLVFAYCALGMGLAAYSITDAGFLATLPQNSAGSPNINLVFPHYVLREFSPGLVGLVIVGIFAAAMSSIDSALNSLSASSVEDFIGRFRKLDEKQLFFCSKGMTLAWGCFAVVFSFQVENIAPTVLEAINKVGSMLNGPLLGIFVGAIFLPKLKQAPLLVGFGGALLINILLWQYVPTLSWLWWNPIGFFVCISTAILISLLDKQTRPWQINVDTVRPHIPVAILFKLAVAFASILFLLAAIQWWAFLY